MADKKKEKETETKGVLDKALQDGSSDKKGQWYVAQTYSGYEDQVASGLKKRIKSLNMKDLIFEIIVPTEKQIEVKNGVKKVKVRKIFPGYVLVRMSVTEDSWFVVRNTPNVTGLLGFGTVPSAVNPQELSQVKKKMDKEQPKFDIDFKKGDQVKIVDGPFKDFEGSVEEVDKDKGKVKILVDMFGRETPVDLDFLQAKKI